MLAAQMAAVSLNAHASAQNPTAAAPTPQLLSLEAGMAGLALTNSLITIGKSGVGGTSSAGLSKKKKNKVYTLSSHFMFRLESASGALFLIIARTQFNPTRQTRFVLPHVRAA